MGLVWITVSRRGSGGQSRSGAAQQQVNDAGGAKDDECAADTGSGVGATACAPTPEGSSSSSSASSSSSSSSSAPSASGAPSGPLLPLSPGGCGIDAVALVNAIMADIGGGALPVIRNVVRLVPLQAIVGGYDADILAALKPLAAVAFPRPDPPRTVTWAAEFRSRNNATVSKGEMLACAGLCLPGATRVDLVAPEVLLVMEVFRAFAGLSVVPAGPYNAAKRYNIRLLTETPEERDARLRAAAEAQARADGKAKAASSAATALVEASSAAATSAAEGGGGGGLALAGLSAGAGEEPAENEEGDEEELAPGPGPARTDAIKGGRAGDSSDEDSDDDDGGAAVTVFAKKPKPAAAPASAASSSVAVAIEHDQEGKRFLARLSPSSAVAAFLEYALVQASASTGVSSSSSVAAMDIPHTFTEPAHRGQGLAAQVTGAAFEWAMSRGLAVVPSCAYVRETFIPRRTAAGRPMPAVLHTGS